MSDPVVAAVTEVLEHGIPLTGFMGVRVAAWDGQELRLEAPYDRNRNHKGSVFGGSIAALATVTGWTAAEMLLRSNGLDAGLVIYRSELRYRLPVTDAVVVSRCRLPPPADVTRFLRDFGRLGRASLELKMEVLQNGRAAVRYSGEYVARREGNR